MSAIRKLDFVKGAALTAAALCILAAPSAAQRVSSSSSYEHGGDGLNLVYTQISISPDGRGWQPVGTLSAYWLSVGGDSDDTWSLKPSVGLRYRTGVGYVQGSLGYAFKNDNNSGVNFFDGSENGVSTGLHGEYWDSGMWAGQAIASYNWGSDYLWSRLRGLRRVAELNGGGLSLGAEYVYQGEFTDQPLGNDNILRDDVRTTQFGPVVQLVTAGGTVWAASGGYKDVNLQDGSTWYLKLELTAGLSGG